MSKPVGGRGKVAPYETTHVRVPVPIKEAVNKLVNEYRESLLSDNNYGNNNPKILAFDEALEISRKILKSKKGAKESMSKLLTAIYSQQVNLSDL